jgi:DNA polymerase III epsilon subunit family exonuclease
VDLLAARIRELPLVFLDLETTGLSPEDGHEILEFGAVKTQAGEEKAQIDTLIRPSKPIPPDSVKIHGITDLFVMGAPSFEMAAGDILEFIGDSIIIAHNAPFDVGFLSVALQALGRPLPDNLVLDTVCLSRTVLPQLPNHKLDTLKKQFGVTAERSHRALDDSRALARVFQKLLDQCFHQLEGGPTLSEVATKAAPLFRFHDFSAEGMPVRSPEHRALVRWAMREKAELQLSYASPGRPIPEELRVAPIELMKEVPPVLRAVVRPKGDEQKFQLERIKGCRRAL